MDKVREMSRDGLLRIFERFDKDGDGSIDEGEFGEVLDALGWDSLPEVRSLEFAVIDDNADGEVEFREFAEWWLDRN